jgi:hypothetical protein
MTSWSDTPAIQRELIAEAIWRGARATQLDSPTTSAHRRGRPRVRDPPPDRPVDFSRAVLDLPPIEGFPRDVTSACTSAAAPPRCGSTRARWSLVADRIFNGALADVFLIEWDGPSAG